MTQDLGRVDQNGYLQITGRIKDIIIRGGHNIHPAKIEALAMRHPGVAAGRCGRRKGRTFGERVCIVVMPKDTYPLIRPIFSRICIGKESQNTTCRNVPSGGRRFPYLRTERY